MCGLNSVMPLKHWARWQSWGGPRIGSFSILQAAELGTTDHCPRTRLSTSHALFPLSLTTLRGKHCHYSPFICEEISERVSYLLSVAQPEFKAGHCAPNYQLEHMVCGHAADRIGKYNIACKVL